MSRDQKQEARQRTRKEERPRKCRNDENERMITDSNCTRTRPQYQLNIRDGHPHRWAELRSLVRRFPWLCAALVYPPPAMSDKVVMRGDTCGGRSRGRQDGNELHQTSGMTHRVHNVRIG
jgi:hypothetical protein